MASRVMHLAIANEIMKQVQINDIDRFRLGVVLPDAYKHNIQSATDSHLKYTTEDGTKKTYKLAWFRETYGEKMKTDELYLGYYLHLIQDTIFRYFVYSLHNWDPYPKGNIERLHNDYKLLNNYVVNEYNISNYLVIPQDINEELIFDIYPFDTKQLSADFKKDFEPYSDGEAFFFTQKMADEYIKMATEKCLEEIKAFIFLYLELKALGNLTFETFQRAVKHAKIISLNPNLPFLTSKEWFSLVVLESKEFEKCIKNLENGEIARKEALSVKREVRDKELVEISNFCNEHNLSESTKTKLVCSGKSYSEISIVWSLCKQSGISEYVFSSLVKNNVSYTELEKRISKIKYYIKNYPELNIALSSHVLNSEQEFNRYIKTCLQKPMVNCMGDCSNCKREKCIIDT